MNWKRNWWILKDDCMESARKERHGFSQWNHLELELSPPYQDFMIAMALCFWKLPSLFFHKPKARGKNVLIHTPSVSTAASGVSMGSSGLNRAGRPSACGTRNLESAKKMTQWCFQGTSVGVERVTTPTPNPKTLWPGTIQCNSHISDGKVKPYSRPHSPVTTWGQPLRCT